MDRTYENWEIKSNRFVAFLDIMGFKDMVTKKSHDEIFSMLDDIVSDSKLLESALERFGQNIKIITFSDSIIILSKSDSSVVKYIDFSNAVSKIIGISIYKGIPIKGGCAYGLVSYDQDKNILCGQAYVDAVEIQERLHYYGVACHYSIDKYFSDIKTGFGLHTFKSKTIFKDYDAMHYNLDWFYSLCEAYYLFSNPFEERDALIREKINNFYLQASGKSRVYIDNTIEMYNRYLKTKPLFSKY